MSKDAILAAVADAYARGICIVPPAQDGTKRPDVRTWSAFQKERPTQAVLKHWYSNGRTGIGWVCGAVSGGLEVIDFDDRQIYSEYNKMAKAAGLGDLLARIEKGYFEQSPNGAHLPYFCEQISGSLKLAKRRTADGKFKCLIETRGEGGYIIVAPTFGSVNPSGPYKLVSGSISTIVQITPAERRQLHDLARVFDEAPQKTTADIVLPSGLDGRPGDDYAAKTTWAQILEPHGWKRVYRRLEVTAWRRPGKDDGISATTNYAGSDLLYVFSTSTPFDSERGINKFAAYAVLEHNGDFAAAARELRLLGYGAKEAPLDVDLSGILKELDKAKMSEKVLPFPEELLRVPGMIGDLSRYMNETATKSQPILSLAAAIAAVATIVGRKVQTETGTRSNVYILATGNSGTGKEWPRQVVSDVFHLAGASELIAAEDLASDAAINTILVNTPACLFLIDEIGHLLKTLSSDKASHYHRNVIAVFLRVYGQAGGIYRGKAYADAERLTIVEQPNLSIYGTTVPGRLYESLSRDQVLDGFLSRFLIFESESDNPPLRRIDVRKRVPPDELVTQFRRWFERSSNEEATGNLDQLRPRPKIVPATPQARTVFSDLESDMHKLRDVLLAQGEDPAIYMRTTHSAQKLALIRACGIQFEPEITERDAVWGAKLAAYLSEALARRVELSVSDNATEALTRRVADIIRGAGKEGITRRQLTRKTQWLKRLERQDILGTLCESGQVSEEVTAVKKTKLTTYRWAGTK